MIKSKIPNVLELWRKYALPHTWSLFYQFPKSLECASSNCLYSIPEVA